ncbi:MAG: NADH-quinone oxidoreductase subunit C, partial [Gaiellaceae bacterium]
MSPVVTSTEFLDGRFRAESEPGAPGERRLVLPAQSLDRAVAALLERGARFVTVTVSGSSERSVVAVLAFGGELVVLRAPLQAEQPTYPSLSLVTPAAILPERELRDLYGVEPLGHPDPEP